MGAQEGLKLAVMLEGRKHGESRSSHNGGG